MTLSNAFPAAAAREWAQSPMLKRRLDPQADYQKQAWDGERSHDFATWQPVVLSQEEIAKLHQKPKNEPKENPISDTPEAFQKANKPTDTGADTPGQNEGNDGLANEAAQEAASSQADGGEPVESHSEPAAPAQDNMAQASGLDQSQDTSERQSEVVSQDAGVPSGDQDQASSARSARHADAASGAGAEPGQQDSLAQSHAQGHEEGYAKGHAEGYQQGFDEGKAQAHAAGLSEGIEQGLAQAAQQQDAALDKAIAALTQAAADITTLNDNPKQHFEPLKRLALHLAEELVRGELMRDSAAIERLIQAALEQLDNPSKRVRVALHPDDMAALTAQGKQLGAGVVMVADKAMLRGGVRVTSNDAVVQDLIDNRLGHLADELLIDKAQWLNSSEALQQGTAWATKASVLERMSATEDVTEVVAPVADTQPAAPVPSPSSDEPGMSGIDRMSEADALDDDPIDYSLDVSDTTDTSDETAAIDVVGADLVQADPVQEQPVEQHAAAETKDVEAAAHSEPVQDLSEKDAPSDSASDDEQA
ncbi:hypothetical protein LN050_09945 [Comamonadaceae bacterium M7527]|nr:hypothetical protein LN050_09945 [Comamonadaceae bacterium M7527]